MSMFDFLKRNNENDDHNEPVRIGLEHQQQWTEIQDLSHQQPVYVFKHSSNCGISSMVLKRFEKVAVPVFRLDVSDDNFYQENRT